MKRPVRQNDGLFHLEGKTFKQLFGSREQVFNGTAYKTTGCLTKKNLHFNKRGRIVSLKKFNTSIAEKRLLQHGYSTQKGKFGYVKCDTQSKTHTTRSGQKITTFKVCSKNGKGKKTTFKVYQK